LNNSLELINITKRYLHGRIEVLAIDRVSLAMRSGEVLLIMGPSGSGKTTLLSMMGCILKPTSGKIKIDEQVVSGMGEAELPDIRKKYFGFVFQSFNLFPSLTARENIELLLRLKGFRKESIMDESQSLIEKVELSKRADFLPHDLSGGEKQRVAIARALSGDPMIILADEPTANLDSRTGKEILLLLRKNAIEYGKAVAIVSHDPKADAVADRIIHLEDGRIKE